MFNPYKFIATNFAIYLLVVIGLIAAFSPFVFILYAVLSEGIGINRPTVALVCYLLLMVAAIISMRGDKFVGLNVSNRIPDLHAKELGVREKQIIVSVTIVAMVFLGKPVFDILSSLFKVEYGYFFYAAGFLLLLGFLIFSVWQGLRYGIIQLPSRVSSKDAVAMREYLKNRNRERLIYSLFIFVILFVVVFIYGYIRYRHNP